MSEKASFLAGNGIIVGGVAVVAALAFAAMSGVFSPSEPEPAPSEQAQPVATAPVPAQPAPVPTPEPEKDVAEIVRPSFDVVRVETDGNTLIAGQGASSALVKVLMDGAELVQTETDGSGKFVSFVELPPSDQPRVLSLVQEGAEGDVPSEETIILAPTPKPEPVEDVQVAAVEAPKSEAEAAPENETTKVASIAEQPAATTSEEPAAAEPTETTEAQVSAATEVASVVTEEDQEAVLNQNVETETSSESSSSSDVQTSTTVLKADADGVTVLQAPVAKDAAPEVMSAVALDAITYSDEGEVELSGRGSDAGFVRVYLDNQPVTTSRIEEDGNWRTELPDVDTGLYTLRVDQVDEEGAVTSRIETPFKRENETVVEANQQDTQAAPVRVVTVQPGSTLWAIANERYGDGIQYVRVFEANRDRIRNPDLIYPGQIFEIPE